MKPKIWLRSAKRTWLELATDDMGTLDISRIAKRTDLRPETVLFGDLGAYEGITIAEVRDECGSTAGESKESAVLVDGDAAAGTEGLSPGLSEKLLQELTEFMALMKAKYKSKKSVQLSSVSQSIWDTFEVSQIGWMDGSTIYWYTFESRARAVGCIEELLQDSDDDEMGTSEALAICARPHGEDEDLLFIKKRRMYEPPEMDNLKDLVGLIPDEEILGAQVQLGVQQLQKLLHKPLFSGVPDVDVPWPHSMYC